MKYIKLFFCLLVTMSMGAQTVTVKDTVMTTYPFGDPNPIPQVKRNCYPYCNFDEFSTTPEKQSWKMVVLENPYLRVKIFPEIGGKVWSVFDKTAGKEMFYDNNVVKFRDIAMRGPWTSGGIEFNYGVLLIFTLMCMSYWSQLISGFYSVELELRRVME